MSTYVTNRAKLQHDGNCLRRPQFTKDFGLRHSSLASAPCKPAFFSAGDTSHRVVQVPHFVVQPERRIAADKAGRFCELARRTSRTSRKKSTRSLRRVDFIVARSLHAAF